ncbi:unnamed protein product [Clonostachys rosea]|uniref:Uncharacterized protein n=1 Tax=Bionectria ochroleuca TaxID=29856 RepID=A0ABY6UN09_BIOOC|nr:unnamed protein product [Clonostachys rosea]
MAIIGQNWKYVATLGVNVKRLYQYHSSYPIRLEGPPSSLSARQLAGEKDGLVANSPISKRDGNISGHRRLVEQGKLTEHGLEAVDNKAPQSGSSFPTVAEPPQTMDSTTRKEFTFGNRDNHGDRGGELTGSDFISVPRQTECLFQPQAAPILSCFAPSNNVPNLDWDDENEYAMFLSTTMAVEQLDNGIPTDALATWFND